MNLEVHAATSGQWDDVAAIFAGRKGPNACWCQRFRHHDLADNQAALRQEIDNNSVPIGLVAYAGQSPDLLLLQLEVSESAVVADEQASARAAEEVWPSAVLLVLDGSGIGWQRDRYETRRTAIRGR